MAPVQQVQVQRTPVRLTAADATRIMVVLVGSALLLAAILSPWWTRGMTVSGADASDRAPGVEGFYLNYGPFTTPGSLGGFTTDASRAAAVAILGTGLLLCGAFLACHHVLRFARHRGLVEVSAALPVRFAIAAFWAGLFAVLWGAFFLPLLGNNPGFLWGAEYGASAEAARQGLEVTRYANVGFFLGLVGAVAFPAWTWRDAQLARRLEEGDLRAPAASPRARAA